MKILSCAVVRLLFRVAKDISRYPIGLVILGVAMLSQTARSATSYTNAVLADNPVAFWQLSETNDPSTGILPAVDCTGHGYNGTYGTTSLNGFNGIVGPQPP